MEKDDAPFMDGAINAIMTVTFPEDVNKLVVHPSYLDIPCSCPPMTIALLLN